MAFDTSCLFYSSQHRRSGSFRTFFFVPVTLALLTSLFILLYISTTSNLFSHTHPNTLPAKPLSGSSLIFDPTHKFFTFLPENASTIPPKANASTIPPEADWRFDESRRSTGVPLSSIGDYINNNQLYHDKYIFLEDYKEMKRSFKIYVYPHGRDVPFANALLPDDFEPGGNYASESYFKKVLLKSQFMTNDPNKADLFFLPFSIARLRYDPRVGVGGIQDFIRDYNLNISQMYPYWNRTGGADHFYVACHSIGRKAMEKASEVKHNAIQVVCSSSYFLPGYIPHKDACLPQIWPREGEPPDLVSSKRTQLAFFAGAINSPVRQKLLEVWRNDTEIFAHYGRLKTPYADELLRSKFCLHVKGFEVNTARIGDALYYGCVPVMIADYYDLPFADIINWRSFSVVVTTLDIPLLKKVLKGISPDEYLRLKSNVLKVRKHFIWHPSPIDYDAFYMVMYELWLRRSILRIS